MRFETQTDLDREEKAIRIFCQKYDCTYRKLGHDDIDFELIKNGKVIAHCEVKGRNKNIDFAYPLPLSVSKMVKLIGKGQKKAIVIWICKGGLLYADVRKLHGWLNYNGRKPREGSYNDVELMAYFLPQDALKEITF